MSIRIKNKPRFWHLREVMTQSIRFYSQLYSETKSLQSIAYVHLAVLLNMNIVDLNIPSKRRTELQIQWLPIPKPSPVLVPHSPICPCASPAQDPNPSSTVLHSSCFHRTCTNCTVLPPAPSQCQRKVAISHAKRLQTCDRVRVCLRKNS